MIQYSNEAIDEGDTWTNVKLEGWGDDADMVNFVDLQ